jgi:hypothetical protein
MGLSSQAKNESSERCVIATARLRDHYKHKNLNLKGTGGYKVITVGIETNLTICNPKPGSKLPL